MQRIFLLSLLAGIIGAFIASGKGRSAPLWFFICFLMPLSLLVLSFLPKRTAPKAGRECPHCGARINREDTVCPRCNRMVPVSITMVKCPSCEVMVQEKERCDHCGRPL
ncbi:MAG: double zinc ribbon domain-containing protein [bacterium]